MTSGSNIDTTSTTCTVTSNRYLTISGGFTGQVSAGQTLVISVSNITNHDTTETSSVFEIETQTSTGEIIDTYQETSATVTATPETLTTFSVATAETIDYTGVEDTYTFTFDFSSQSVLLNSYISIIFPSEITISDTSYAAGTCTINVLQTDVDCSFSGSQTLVASGMFSQASYLISAFTIQLEGIQNPRSTEESSAFQVIVYGPEGNQQYTSTTVTFTPTAASDFQSIVVTPGSESNGDETSYTFSLTLSNYVNENEYVQITFPTEVVLTTSPICTGITALNTTLTCNTTLTASPQVLDVLITPSSGTVISSGTLMEFTVSNVTNPGNLDESGSFTVETITSTTAPIYKMNSRTTGLTITNSQRGSISDASAVPDSTALSVNTSYTIAFTPTNVLPQNAQVLITIPEEIVMPSISATLACASITYIESTLQCNYDTANRVVTITNGFVTQTSYPASQISVKIDGLVNPSTALTTESFIIETKDASGASIDYVGTGVTYTKSCNSPCLTCSGDLSNCTSCDSSSTYPYLFSSTCLAVCPSGYYQDLDDTCKECLSPCATCEDSENRCLSCISSPYRILYGYSCVESCPRFYTDNNQKCELLTESVIPFMFLIAFGVFFMLVTFLKIMKSHTLFFSSLV